MPTITLENVTKNYKLDRRQQKEQKGKRYEVGVEDINLTIRQGEFVFLVGSSRTREWCAWTRRTSPS